MEQREQESKQQRRERLRRAAELRHQRSLIHGLPDHLVAEEILPRASAESWWDRRSVRAVSKGWRGATQQGAGRMLAAVHRVDEDDPQQPLRFAVSVYDAELGRWERLPPIPWLPCGAPASARCICVDGRVFVIGGRSIPHLDFLASVFSINLKAVRPKWERCASMKQARASFACCSWKNTIVVAGGQGSSSEHDASLAGAEAYDIAARRWRPLPELNLPRADATAASMGHGIVLVVGGFTVIGGGLVAARSAEVLKLGSCEEEWGFLEDASDDVQELLRSATISSGVLSSRMHPSAFVRALNSRGWSVVDGRLAAPLEGGGDGGEQEEDANPSVALAAVGEYFTRYSGSGSVVCRLGTRGRVQEVDVPFSLVPSVACCTVEIDN